MADYEVCHFYTICKCLGVNKYVCAVPELITKSYATRCEKDFVKIKVISLLSSDEAVTLDSAWF